VDKKPKYLIVGIDISVLTGLFPSRLRPMSIQGRRTLRLPIRSRSNRSSSDPSEFSLYVSGMRYERSDYDRPRRQTKPRRQAGPDKPVKPKTHISRPIESQPRRAQSRKGTGAQAPDAVTALDISLNRSWVAPRSSGVRTLLLVTIWQFCNPRASRFFPLLAERYPSIRGADRNKLARSAQAAA
jgi:hypothetical protein